MLMITLFFQASLIILVLLILLWVVSVFIKNVSIVDLFWGFGFVVINTFYVLSSSEVTARQLLVLVLVSVWGLRLSVYLAWRNIGKAEDFRYQEFRRKYGPERYWWFSFFQTFLLQGVLMMLISTPLLGANFGEQNSGLQWLDYAGILVWIIGFSFEAGGDFQLARFKSNPQNKGKVLNTGFWKYTRHPNYFGDSAVWWSYALFCIAAGSYWLSLGSVLMTLLIIKVSGVALLEISLTNTKPQYSEYIRKTNAFIPWFPKK